MQVLDRAPAAPRAAHYGTANSTRTVNGSAQTIAGFRGAPAASNDGKKVCQPLRPIFPIFRRLSDRFFGTSRLSRSVALALADRLDRLGGLMHAGARIAQLRAAAGPRSVRVLSVRGGCEIVAA